MTNQECARWLLSHAKEKREEGNTRLAEYLSDAAAKAALAHADGLLAAGRYAREHA